MAQSKNLIGRVVQLKGIESKPELNGRYGLVQGYNKDKDRYCILPLDYSTPTVIKDVLLLKYEKMLILSPKYDESTIYSFPLTLREYLSYVQTSAG
jgi:hypothetical protein